MLSVGSLLSLSLWTLFSGDLRNTEPWRTGELRYGISGTQMQYFSQQSHRVESFKGYIIIYNLYLQHYFTWNMLSLYFFASLPSRSRRLSTCCLLLIWNIHFFRSLGFACSVLGLFYLSSRVFEILYWVFR